MARGTRLRNDPRSATSPACGDGRWAADGSRAWWVLLCIVLLLVPAFPAQAGGGGGGNPVVTPGIDRVLDHPSGEDLELIVLFEAPPTQHQVNALRDHGLTDLATFSIIPAVGARGTPLEARAALGTVGVQDVYPSEPLEAHLAESRVTIEADHVPRSTGIAGANVTVAVVDSGIDADHPAFDDRVQVGMRFSDDGAREHRRDADGHGTHIAGIVAGNGAESRDGRQRGVAPEAGLVGLDISHPFTTKNALRAFEWIHENHEEEGIRVVSNSWGRDRDETRFDPDDPVVRASSALVADGLVVVFSAGNKGDAPSSLTLEAMNPNVVTVGATDDQGHVTEYSSRGPPLNERGEPLPWTKPDVVAPGNSIVSARTQDGDGSELHALVRNSEDRYYVSMNGTSMAAPHVAGVAALLLDEEPTLTPLAVKSLLQAAAVDRGETGPDDAYGYGLVNAHTALEALSADKGEEVVVTRERRVPVHEEGSLVVAQDGVVVEDRSARAPPRDAVEHTVDVPPRGRNVVLTFSWTASSADFVVTLERGNRELGPFTSEDPTQEVTMNVSVPQPGSWTVRAEPRSTVSQTDYVLHGYVTVLETRVMQGPDGSGSLGDPPQLRGDGDYFEEPRTPQDALLRAVDGAVVTPPRTVTALLGLGGLAAGFVLRTIGPSRFK